MTEDRKTLGVRDEHHLKVVIVRALQGRASEHESQHKCAKAWGIPQPTVNYIVNAKMERLTIKQLLGIAWKSGATINIGLSYAN